MFWLKAFIPKDFPGVRVMSYGYDAQTVFSQSVATIRDQAIALLNAILDERSDSTARHRPIIFMAHSLGGIIVKKVVSTCFHQVYPDHDDLLSCGHLLPQMRTRPFMEVS